MNETVSDDGTVIKKEKESFLEPRESDTYLSYMKRVDANTPEGFNAHTLGETFYRYYRTGKGDYSTIDANSKIF